MNRGQRQSGGKDSINIQAHNDINLYGASIEDMHAIALDVFRSNFLELRDVAAEVALGRAEKITRDFLEELWKRAPEALNNMQDPDVQRSLFRAQSEFACSGDEDLEKALVDLLIDRAAQEERDIKTVVLNEAILTVPKLTPDQRAAIALCFVIRHARYGGPLILQSFYEYLSLNWVPLGIGLPSRASAYQHIEYVGAASIVRITQLPLEDALIKTSGGFFTKGFPIEEIPERLRKWPDLQRILIPCLRAPDAQQLGAMAEQDINNLTQDKDLARQLTQLSGKGQMTHPEIKSDVIEHVPALINLFDTWNNSESKKYAAYNSRHRYWSRVLAACERLQCGS